MSSRIPVMSNQDYQPTCRHSEANYRGKRLPGCPDCSVMGSVLPHADGPALATWPQAYRQ